MCVEVVAGCSVASEVELYNSELVFGCEVDDGDGVVDNDKDDDDDAVFVRFWAVNTYPPLKIKPYRKRDVNIRTKVSVCFSRFIAKTHMIPSHS